jgi:signal transduction histidine kinase/ABC-type nitrate/sulfonate/bicarbonate transport system substrate-binding protein
VKFFLSLLLVFNIYLQAKGQKTEDVTLQLNWKHQFEFAGFYIAKEKGFYKQENLNVKIKEFNHNTDILKDVLTQKADFGIEKTDLIYHHANGKKIKLISAIFQSSPHVLLTTQKSGIQKLEDIKDKTLMAPSHSLKDASIFAMLTAKKINIQDIKIKEPSFKIDDLINGKADITTAYISNEPYKLKKLGYEPVIFSSQDYGFDFYGDLLFTSQKKSKFNPQQISKFKNATLRGWKYAFDNIDETINLILKKYNTQNKTKDELLYEANTLKKLAYKNGKIGELKQEKLEFILNVYKIIGVTHNKTKISDIIYKEYPEHIERLKSSTKFESKLSQEEIKYLNKKREIKMCINPKWMPFESIENNRHIGITSDFFKIFEKQIATPINLKPTDSWSQSLEYVKSRKCDILSLDMPTDEKKLFLNYTTPYLMIPLVIATKLDVTFITNLDSIGDKKIALQKNSAFVEILKNRYKNLNIIEVDNIEDGLKKVKDGELFGYIGTLASVGYMFQTHFTGELKIAGKFDEYWELGIAVRSDDKILFNIFQKLLHEIDQATSSEILNKWVSIKYEKSVDYTLIWQVLIITIIISILFIYRQIALKKHNTELENQITKRREIEKELAKLNTFLEKRVKEEIEKNVKKEKLLQQQSRLAQMGEMISMIAHQWRQPLGAINSAVISIDLKLNSGILDFDDKDDREKIIKFINEKHKNINNYVETLTLTIDDFRNFFKPDKDKEIVRLIAPIQKALLIVDSSLQKNSININLNIDEDDEVEIFQNEILQVILNIIKNAEDNFIEKNSEYRQIDITTQCTNEHCYIKIEDNGGGIEEDIIPNIFDPYFSTKDEKNGTGLGLYMSKIIVEDHNNGELSVKNSQNGACFQIKLPK